MNDLSACTCGCQKFKLWAETMLTDSEDTIELLSSEEGETK